MLIKLFDNLSGGRAPLVEVLWRISCPKIEAFGKGLDISFVSSVISVV